MNSMRIVFFGTPAFAVASLNALHKSGWNVVAVVTAPDKPAGRGQQLQQSEVKKAALQLSIPILQPTNLKDPVFIEQLQAYRAELQIVVAFRMLPEAVWNMPKLGTFNLHASLLPDYRGAAPINWAIIKGEKITGVTTFKLQHMIDTGSILMQKEVEITDLDDAGSLHDKLMTSGAALLVASVEQLAKGEAELIPQPAPKANKEAPKLHKETCKINWNQDAQQVYNFIRGLSPYPGAWSAMIVNGKPETWKFLSSRITEETSANDGTVDWKNGKLTITANDFAIEIKEVQVPGKKKMPAADLLRGLKIDSLSLV